MYEMASERRYGTLGAHALKIVCDFVSLNRQGRSHGDLKQNTKKETFQQKGSLCHFKSFVAKTDPFGAKGL